MKKLLTITLALVMSLSVATLFAACEETPEETHVHTYASEWTSDATYHWKKANCEHTEEIAEKAEHTYGEDNKCTVCGVEKAHEHTYETTWTSDDTHHWHKATCEHTTEVKDKAEHTFGTDGKCTACQKVKPTTPSEHTHTYASDWSSDATHHWHAATCEHTSEVKDKAAHTFGGDRKCTTCQKEKPLPVYTVTPEQWVSALEYIIDGNYYAEVVGGYNIIANYNGVAYREDSDGDAWYVSFDEATSTGVKYENTTGTWSKNSFSSGSYMQTRERYSLYALTYLSNEFSTTQGGTKKAIEEMHTAFNYNEGEYTATLYKNSSQQCTYTFKFEDGKIVYIKYVDSYETLTTTVIYEGFELVIPEEALNAQ